uniref:Uncharacterized protein n=1 Tax=Cannabis sativa TaxID=3483 RepID=A0A803PIV6_CANSA
MSRGVCKWAFSTARSLVMLARDFLNQSLLANMELLARVVWFPTCKAATAAMFAGTTTSPSVVGAIGVIGEKCPTKAAGVEVSPTCPAISGNKLRGLTWIRPTPPMMASIGVVPPLGIVPPPRATLPLGVIPPRIGT